MSDEAPPSGRAQRAVPLIAVAVVVTVLAGLVYIRNVGPSAATGLTRPTPIPVLEGPYTATYDFVNPTLGWALVVEYGASTTPRLWIFKTSDGARHWQQLYKGVVAGGNAYINFFDAQHGFAYAGYDTAYRTADGGAHWESVQVAGSLTFVSPLIGWAVDFDPASDSAHLNRTVDGGKTWMRLATDLPTSAVQSVAFRDGSEGWLGTGYLASPVVFVTLDGGSSWHQLDISASVAAATDGRYLTSVRIVPGGAVLALVTDDSGHVLGALLTGNRGGSWRKVTFPIEATFDDLTFADATNWWLLRSGYVSTTPNAGLNWRHIVPVGLRDGWAYTPSRGAIDAHHAWWSMVSSFKSTNTALAMTSDGGEHWTMVNVPQPR